jgi:hypothetical protein
MSSSSSKICLLTVVLFLSFCCFCGTGVWTQVFMLLSQGVYCLSHASNLGDEFCVNFCFGSTILSRIKHYIWLSEIFRLVLLQEFPYLLFGLWWTFWKASCSVNCSILCIILFEWKPKWDCALSHLVNISEKSLNKEGSLSLPPKATSWEPR